MTNNKKENIIQMGFYIDQTRCTGCFSCVIACKDWNDVAPGKTSWRRVVGIEQGKFPEVSVYFLSLSCLHCAKPVCAKACPAGAISKDGKRGLVLVDREVCWGGQECGFACQKACPYDIPQFGLETNPKMQKCDFCRSLVIENKTPICVAACPTYALEAGPLDELRKKYGDTIEVTGFRYLAACKPSVIFKPKRRVSSTVRNSNKQT